MSLKHLYFALKQEMSKKGAAVPVKAVIGFVIAAILIGTLLPQIFSPLSAANVTAAGGPAWASTVVPIVVAAGIVMFIWRIFAR